LIEIVLPGGTSVRVDADSRWPEFTLQPTISRSGGILSSGSQCE
jgi:hypothetical protein